MYRDCIRRFLRGDNGVINELATRLCGSSDLYQQQNRLPISGINFITCHDGFTLNDLFSYNDKHNVANGENNRDGCNNNLSYNYGAEGPTKNSAITALRRKQSKNAYAMLLLSLGVPMLLAGNEFLHSQQGNNNCYCQDNELSWLDWNLCRINAEILRFVQLMIKLRKRHSSLQRRNFLNGDIIAGRNLPDISWHGNAVDQPPEWQNPESKTLAYTLAAVDADEADLYVVLNMSEHKQVMQLPEIPGSIWCLAVDTALSSPKDIVLPKDQKPVSKHHYHVEARSVLILENRPAQADDHDHSTRHNVVEFFNKMTTIKLFD